MYELNTSKGRKAVSAALMLMKQRRDVLKNPVLRSAFNRVLDRIIKENEYMFKNPNVSQIQESYSETQNRRKTNDAEIILEVTENAYKEARNRLLGKSKLKRR